jgi:hypothetical protein
MTVQTITIGKRRFVLLPERDFQRLAKRAEEAYVRPDFAQEALRELKAYKRTGKAADWQDVKRRLSL